MSVKTLTSKQIYRNRWLSLREDSVVRNNHQEGIFAVVDKPDCVLIIPLNNDVVHLVEQYRYAIRQRTVEFPQGSWDRAASLEEIARGELLEEVGLTAKAMKNLGQLGVAQGFVNQRQHVFLATGLSAARGVRDPEEHDMSSLEVSCTDFEKMILSGAICDASTIAAWGLYKLHTSKKV